MTLEIYQDALKTLVREAHGAGRLPAPDVSVKLDNPFCGDRITLDLKLAGKQIVAIAHDTRGCLLCQAAASLLGRDAAGRSTADLAAMHAEIIALLQGNPSSGQWPALALFLPVISHRSRHGCVLLPFRALQTACGNR